jgi:pimeloyl-ACP methyl ester carboxylesterase
MKTLITILTGAVLVMTFGGCASTRAWYHLPTLEFDEIDYGYQIHHAEVDGMRIAYLDEGHGDQTLLLIHGLGTSAKGWQRNIPALSRHHRVIALDLPGYGHSSKGHYPYSMRFHAEAAAGLLAALGLERAVWVGHSMGGQIALTAALELPERVTGLVLLSTAGFEAFTEGEGDWMKGAVTPKFVAESPVRQIAANLHSNFQRTPPEAEFFITDRIQIRGAQDFDDYCYAVWRNVAAMLDGPTHDRLTEIDRPTLIVFGERDRLIPNPYLHGGWTRDVAAFGHERIAGSRLVMLPETGHMTMFERPDEVNEAIREFVGQL